MPVAARDPVLPNSLELVTPLEPIVDDCRTGMSVTFRDSTATLVAAPVDSLEMVGRNVEALLNTLTGDNFDPVSDQIIDWANKSENEKDGRTLVRVVQVVYDKAIDDVSSEIYALLCRKMMEEISHDVQDDRSKDLDGKPITGPKLFRTYVLRCCRKGLERASLPIEWKDEGVAWADHTDDCEGECYSNEECTVGTTKRRELGLIRFIGELFKVQILEGRIIHLCVRKLLVNSKNPKEEDLEKLCELMKTVGQVVDTGSSVQKAYMSFYVTRIRELKRRPSMNVHTALMLQDIVDLRKRGWQPQINKPGRPTLSEAHEIIHHGSRFRTQSASF